MRHHRVAPDRLVSFGTARLPPGRRVYAVGDIHGRCDLLAGILERIDADIAAAGRTQAEIVFLGDYIDRGGQTAAVVDMLIALTARHRTVFLKGNHEALLLRVLSEPSWLERWAEIGGLPTLVSYGVCPPVHRAASDAARLVRALKDAVPLAHRVFYAALRPVYVAGDFLFVHAGIDPRRPWDDQVEHDLLTIRHRFLSCPALFPKLVVHGHTPVPAPECRANRIAIDTGAYATGRLTAVRIEGSEVTVL